MESIDPYKMPAGANLDRRIHRELFAGQPGETVPSYSTDLDSSQLVVKGLREKYGVEISCGRTRWSKRPWFARWGSDTSTSTEVIAETLPIAICRLALIMAEKCSPATPQPSIFRTLFRKRAQVW